MPTNHVLILAPNKISPCRVLLYNLALLEYNDFYCRSHPVIRTTNAYRAARGALENVGTG